MDVRIEGWNPLIPGDAEASGLPVAALRFVVVNKTGHDEIQGVPLRALIRARAMSV